MKAQPKPRLHPQSWRELRQLVKLHGSAAIQEALTAINAEVELSKLTKAGDSNERVQS